MRSLFSLVAALFVLSACSETPTEPDSIDPQFGLVAEGWGGHSPGKIVFDQDGDIWVMNADRSGLKNLTDDDANNNQPTWSSDGGQIVFASDGDIYVMNADGSNRTRVTSAAERDQHPHMSPDGKQIAFTRDVEMMVPPQNYVINVDGTGETNLTNNEPPACFMGPATPPGCFFEAYPRWSPDGEHILYNSSTSPGDADIFVMRADGSEKTNLTNSPGVNDFFASWSRNGRRIAFSSGVPFGPDARPENVYVMNRRGKRVTQVTDTPDRDIAPSWSPNGRELAFYQLTDFPENQLIGISTVHLDGTNQTQLTGPAANPHWARGRLPRVRMVPFFAHQTQILVDPVGVECPDGEQAGMASAEGKATRFGRYTATHVSCLSAPTGTFSSQSQTMTFRNGDELRLETGPTNAGEVVVFDPDTGAGEAIGEINIVGGTGRFAGATGWASFTIVFGPSAPIAVTLTGEVSRPLPRER